MPEIIGVHEIAPITPAEDAELAQAMVPVTERLVARHMDNMEEWDPSNLITDHQGRSYAERPWSVAQDRIMPVYAEAALRVNTLTEDNLVAYNHDILRVVEKVDPTGKGPLHDWGHHWTAEEDRHGRVLGLWIHAHAAIDPVQLDRDRFALMRKTEDGTPQHPSLIEAVSYAAIQERATYVAHRNTGKIIGNTAPDGHRHNGEEVLKTIARDETRHYVFYRDWTAEAMKINPSVVMRAIARQVVEFDMPGTGIPNFERQSALIAVSGIYGLKEYRAVLGEVFKRVDVEDTQMKLSPEGRLAQLAIRRRIESIEAEIAQQNERAAQRELRRAAQPSRS